MKGHHWTTDKPTEPGWYWWGGPIEEVVYVAIPEDDRDGGYVWIAGNSVPLQLMDTHDKWFGPITPPE